MYMKERTNGSISIRAKIKKNKEGESFLSQKYENAVIKVNNSLKILWRDVDGEVDKYITLESERVMEIRSDNTILIGESVLFEPHNNSNDLERLVEFIVDNYVEKELKVDLRDDKIIGMTVHFYTKSEINDEDLLAQLQDIYNEMFSIQDGVKMEMSRKSIEVKDIELMMLSSTKGVMTRLKVIPLGSIIEFSSIGNDLLIRSY